jgi:hypothetical protein
MNKPESRKYYDLWDVIHFINAKYQFPFNGCNGGKESNEQREFMDFMGESHTLHNGSLRNIGSDFLSEEDFIMTEKARLFIKCILDEFGEPNPHNPKFKSVKIHYWW